MHLKFWLLKMKPTMKFLQKLSKGFLRISLLYFSEVLTFQKLVRLDFQGEFYDFLSREQNVSKNFKAK